MSEKIEPVLSREEWARVAKDDIRVTLAFPAETPDLPDIRALQALDAAHCAGSG